MLLHKSAGVGRAVLSSSVISRRFKHVLPDLPYDYGALEPVISAEIMRLHHQKHHATYVNNLNVAEEKCHEALQKGDVRAAITLQGALKFNGGGHINHSIFWTNLCKDGGEPSGELLEQIKRDFGTLESLQEKLSAASTAVQGSGWGWLGYNKADKRLQIATCANQDPLEPTTGLCPLFGIDVWEHAYYLQYKNVRPDYVKASIMNIQNRSFHTSVVYGSDPKEAATKSQYDSLKESMDGQFRGMDGQFRGIISQFKGVRFLIMAMTITLVVIKFFDDGKLSSEKISSNTNVKETREINDATIAYLIYENQRLKSQIANGKHVDERYQNAKKA